MLRGVFLFLNRVVDVLTTCNRALLNRLVYEPFLFLIVSKVWSFVSYCRKMHRQKNFSLRVWEHIDMEGGFDTRNTKDRFSTGWDVALFLNILYNNSWNMTCLRNGFRAHFIQLTRISKHQMTLNYGHRILDCCNALGGNCTGNSFFFLPLLFHSL